MNIKTKIHFTFSYQTHGSSNVSLISLTKDNQPDADSINAAAAPSRHLERLSLTNNVQHSKN